MLLLTTEPVRKTLIHLMTGAMSGNNAPVAASADPIEEVAVAALLLLILPLTTFSALLTAGAADRC